MIRPSLVLALFVGSGFGYRPGNGGGPAPAYPAYGNGGGPAPAYPSYGKGGGPAPAYPSYGNGGSPAPAYPSYGNGGVRGPAPAYPAYRKRSVGEESKPMATVVPEISKLLEEKNVLEKPREAKHYHGPAPAYPSYGGGGFGPAPAYPAYRKRSVGEETKPMATSVIEISKLQEDVLKTEEKDIFEKPREGRYHYGPSPAYPAYGGGFGPAPAYPAYGKRSVGDQKMLNKKIILKISKLSEEKDLLEKPREARYHPPAPYPGGNYPEYCFGWCPGSVRPPAPHFI